MKESDVNKKHDGIEMEDGVIRKGCRRTKPVVEATRQHAIQGKYKSKFLCSTRKQFHMDP